MSRKNTATTMRITRRELATVLAALRFHQDENLQGHRAIQDQAVREIATDAGLLKPLVFREVSRLCEMLKTGGGRLKIKRPGLRQAAGCGRRQGETSRPRPLYIDPPQVNQCGNEPLYRVVYIIDIHAANPLDAARQAYGIMVDPESQPPVLEVIDHSGGVVSIDLSEERSA